VPDCLAADLRYALVNDGFNYYYYVYLGLRTSETCMNEFLTDNDAHDVTRNRSVESVELEKPVHIRPLWMDDTVVRQLGWQVGADQRFLPYGARTGTGYTVDMVGSGSATGTDSEDTPYSATSGSRPASRARRPACVRTGT
jgi:hypothetical protein